MKRCGLWEVARQRTLGECPATGSTKGIHDMAKAHIVSGDVVQERGSLA